MELVGRQREQAALGNAIAVAAEADGGILLVAGEGGVGKTALVESALAEDGVLVLRGAADQRAVRPYAPVVAALRGYRRAVPDGLAGSGPLSEHLALILPELGSPPPDTDQATLFEAVANLFEQIAHRQPTVVFLDDLQWVDAATAELLLQLDRTLEAAPVAGPWCLPQRRGVARAPAAPRALRAAPPPAPAGADRRTARPGGHH